MLYARRVPHERLGDAHRLALLGAGLDVASGCGRTNSGLDGPEVRRPVREMQAWQERPDRLVPAFEREAKHPTETPHLSLGELVLRVGLEARVEDSFYCRVPFQVARDLHGVLVVTRDAQLEGLQATDEQVGGEGVEGCAVDLAIMVDPPHEFARSAQNAPEGVRALVYGCGEGAVNHDDRASLMPGLRKPFYVDQLERRVCRRL